MPWVTAAANAALLRQTARLAAPVLLLPSSVYCGRNRLYLGSAATLSRFQSTLMKRALSPSRNVLAPKTYSVNANSAEKNYISYKSYSSTSVSKQFEWKLVNTSSIMSSAVVWFKNDLRSIDNPALYFAAKYSSELKKNCLIGLFVFCLKEMKIHGYSDSKICLLKHALLSLQHTLFTRYSVPLVVVVENDPEDVPLAVERFCVDVKCKGLFYNKQYEADETKRDQIVENLLHTRHSISTWSFDDQCVVLPGTCKTQQGNDYTVFTPFKKRWLSILEEESKKYLHVYDFDSLAFKNEALDLRTEPTTDLDKQLIEVDCSVFNKTQPLTDEDAVIKEAHAFISKRASRYNKTRDFPAVEGGTSFLSPYLALGMISSKYLIAKCKEENHNKVSTGSEGIVTWINELCWRDFYRNIMVAFPRVIMNKPFKIETEKIPWSTDTDAFERWCQGKTGFPIVDAGMRQLISTGWMHNRLRMITAMFLTKDLLINWRWGEDFFMKHLIDGDFASNNGGWQWSASTGTDSQPYFRIFNPVLQSEKFDPNGDFIRKWVPELSSISSPSAIHDPFTRLSKEEFKKLCYPAPIVDHSAARIKTIDIFKQALSR